MEIHICKICKTRFETKYKQAEYCCDECRNIAEKQRQAARVRIDRRKKRKADYVNIYDLINQAELLGISYGKLVSLRSIGRI